MIPALIVFHRAGFDGVCPAAIAKSLGGGGRRGAAGFICEKLPWEDAT